MRLFAIIGATLVAALLAVSGASARAVAHTASSCNISSVWHKLGPTYVESLKVSGGASCSTGETLIKDYNQCRLKQGGAKGVCKSKVLGFSIKETRNTGPDQFVALATAKKGRETITFTYSENTA